MTNPSLATTVVILEQLSWVMRWQGCDHHASFSKMVWCAPIYA